MSDINKGTIFICAEIGGKLYYPTPMSEQSSIQVISDRIGWNIIPVNPQNSDDGFLLSHNNMYISTQTVELPYKNSCLICTTNPGKAAKLLLVMEEDTYHLRLIDNNKVLTLDTRGYVTLFEELHAANAYPYFQHFITENNFTIDLGYEVSKDVKHSDTDSLKIAIGGNVDFQFELMESTTMTLYVRVPKWNGDNSTSVEMLISDNGTDISSPGLDNKGLTVDTWQKTGPISLQKGKHNIKFTTRASNGKSWPSDTGPFYLADMLIGTFVVNFNEWYDFKKEESEEAPSRRLISAAPTSVPTGYLTSFDHHSWFFYFLSYIKWIEYSSWDWFTSPEQSSEYAYESKYSCMVFQRLPFGISELKTKPLPIPPNAEYIEVEFVALFDLSNSVLSAEVYIDDYRREQISVYASNIKTWKDVRIRVQIPKGSKTMRFRAVPEFLAGTIGFGIFIDALSINFVIHNPSVHSYGIALDGGYVQVQDNNAYHFSKNDFTCEAWVRPTYQGPVFGKKATGGKPGFLFQVNPKGVISLVSDDGVGYYLVNSVETNVFDGYWHHIAGVRKNGKMSIYFDGNEISCSEAKSRNTPLNVSNKLDLLIGSVQQEQQIYRFYKGMLSEVRLWNIARTADEIRSAMNICLTGSEANLVGYWPFTDTNSNDHSQLHNNGIPHGMYRYNSSFDSDYVQIIVGKYSSGGPEWAQYVGDHTFVAALKPNSTEKYPNNVDVWFDCGGGHVPSHEYKDLSINVLTVRGKVEDLIWMSTGKPVGPDNPKKNAYGTDDVTGKETAGLYMSGLYSKEGACHQVVNRLLWAATWRQGLVTLADADDIPRGYWLARTVWGLFGDKATDMLVRGYDFKKWCEKIQFPAIPPKDVANIKYNDEL